MQHHARVLIQSTLIPRSESVTESLELNLCIVVLIYNDASIYLFLLVYWVYPDLRSVQET